MGRYMTSEQKREHFTARAEALRGIFTERESEIASKIASLAEQRRKLGRVSDAILCAENLALQGFAETSAEMLDHIASDSGTWLEFNDAERRILDAIDADAGDPEGDDGSAHRDGFEQGEAALGVGEIVS